MERHRIDHWLKLVCIFKHRGDATEACRGGHVKITGQRVQPSAPVRESDVVEFYLNERFRKVIVTVLPETQPAKDVARTMYVDESPVQQTAPISSFRDRGAGRPTKKDRRDQEKWKR